MTVSATEAVQPTPPGLYQPATHGRVRGQGDVPEPAGRAAALPGPDEPGRLRRVPRPVRPVHLAGEDGGRRRPDRGPARHLGVLRREQHGRQERDLPRRRRQGHLRSGRLGHLRRHRPDAPDRRPVRVPRPGAVHRHHPRTSHRRPPATPATPLPDPSPPDQPPPSGDHHASLSLRRHQRPAREPDHARRDRQQHRQREHRRLQVQLHGLPGHPVPDADRQLGARRRRRWHQPDPGRARRAGRRDQHQLQPGLGADHRSARPT